MEEDYDNSALIKSIQEDLDRLKENHITLMIDYKLLHIDWEINLNKELHELIKPINEEIVEKEEQGEITEDIDFRI